MGAKAPFIADEASLDRARVIDAHEEFFLTTQKKKKKKKKSPSQSGGV
jgi:hypothetical protein